MLLACCWLLLGSLLPFEPFELADCRRAGCLVSDWFGLSGSEGEDDVDEDDTIWFISVWFLFVRNFVCVCC